MVLLSPCGWGNLGDAAIQDAVIEHLRRRHPGVRITAATLNPEDTERRHGVPALTLSGPSTRSGYWVRPQAPRDAGAGGVVGAPARPPARDRVRTVARLVPGLRAIRRGLAPLERTVRTIVSETKHAHAVRRLLRDSDLVVVSGGGQLDDEFGGAWGHPYVLAKWAVLARAAGVPLVVLSVGTCKLRSSWSRFFVKVTLRRAAYRSFRDATSRDLVRALGAAAGDPIVADLAFSRSIDPVAPEHRPGTTVIGLSPMAFQDPRIWPDKNPAAFSAYLDKIARLAEWAVRAGHLVLWFHTDTADMRVIADVKARVAPDVLASGRFLEPPIESVSDLVAALQTVDVAVASRLHGVLLASAVGKPVVALSYDRKVSALMDDLGEAAYCHDIAGSSVAEVIASCTERLSAGKPRTDARLESWRAALDRQYDRVLALAPPVRR